MLNNNNRSLNVLLFYYSEVSLWCPLTRSPTLFRIDKIFQRISYKEKMSCSSKCSCRNVITEVSKIILYHFFFFNLITTKTNFKHQNNPLWNYNLIFQAISQWVNDFHIWTVSPNENYKSLNNDELNCQGLLLYGILLTFTF